MPQDPINLWQLITASSSRQSRPEAVTALGNSARWNGQEITIEPTDEGWVLRIFSCHTEPPDDTGIDILIPIDHNKPAKIIKDRNGRWEYHHDQ